MVNVTSRYSGYSYLHNGKKYHSHFNISYVAKTLVSSWRLYRPYYSKMKLWRQVSVSDQFVTPNPYSHQWVNLGQKVWIVQKHIHSMRFRVVFDFVDEITRYGIPYIDNALIDYWLTNNSIGHGQEFGNDFFDSKQGAERMMASMIDFYFYNKYNPI